MFRQFRNQRKWSFRRRRSPRRSHSHQAWQRGLRHEPLEPRQLLTVEVIVPLADVVIAADGDPDIPAIDLSQHFSDLDGDALTYNATSSNEALVTVDVDGNNLITSYQPYVAGQDRTPATIEVTATSIDGQADDTFSYTVLPTLTAEMILVAVDEPTDAGTEQAPGPARGTNTRPTDLPNAIDRALVGQTYHVEIWMRDLMVDLSNRTAEINNETEPYDTKGLTGARVNVEFEPQFAEVQGWPDSSTVLTNHAGWFDFISDADAGDPPLVDNVNGRVNGFNGGNVSTVNLGVVPDYVRLGYIDMRAIAATDGTTTEMVLDVEQLARQANVPEVLGLIDLSQIDVTNVSIEHVQTQQFTVQSGTLTVTGRAQHVNDGVWHDFIVQGTGSDTTLISGTVDVLLDNVVGPTMIEFATANLDLSYAGTWEPGLGGSAGSAPANFGLKAEDVLFVNNTLSVAGRDLTAALSTSGPVAISNNTILSSLLDWSWFDGFFDSKAVAGVGERLDVTGLSLTDLGSDNATLVGSHGYFQLTLPFSKTISFTSSGGGYNIELNFDGVVTANYAEGGDKIGVHRGIGGTGYFMQDSNGSGRWDAGDRFFAYGRDTDIPLVGDWNGDGYDQIGAFRNINGFGYFLQDSNSNGAWDAGDRVMRFLNGTDKPLVGDWDGDGDDEIGAFRNIGGQGYFLQDLNANGVWDAGDRFYRFGLGTDRPLVGDWDGDGDDEIGTFRNIGGYAYFLLDINSSGAWDAGDQYYIFGSVTDTPIIGDWDGDGADQIAVHRNIRGYGYFIQDYNGSGAWDAGDQFFFFLEGTDTPLVGNWSLASPLLAASGLSPLTTQAAPLTNAELAPVVEAAIDLWSSAAALTGEQAATLQNVDVRIADLSGQRLGEASGTSITLDVNAAGYGWFVDLTPWDSSEFELVHDSGPLTALSEGPAADRFDLFTAVVHELGHILGYGHDEQGVMDDTLSLGTRRLLSEDLAGSGAGAGYRVNAFDRAFASFPSR